MKVNKAEVERYLKKWIPRLYLSEWDFALKYTKEDGDNYAEIQADHVYLRATITINKPFWTAAKHYREQIIVHELCHCHTEAIYTMCIDLLNDKKLAHDTINNERERLTERMAKLIFR